MCKPRCDRHLGPTIVLQVVGNGGESRVLASRPALPQIDEGEDDEPERDREHDPHRPSDDLARPDRESLEDTTDERPLRVDALQGEHRR
jgi:hypothetical protein